MWSYCTIKFCLKYEKFVSFKKNDQKLQNSPCKIWFSSEKQYLELHKIRTYKDLAIIFFLKNQKIYALSRNLCLRRF